MNIAVIGGNGQLGSDVVRILLIGATRSLRSRTQMSNCQTCRRLGRVLLRALWISWSILRRCITLRTASSNRIRLMP